jgi:hypothetical protein
MRFTPQTLIHDNPLLTGTTINTQQILAVTQIIGHNPLEPAPATLNPIINHHALSLGYLQAT